MLAPGQHTAVIGGAAVVYHVFGKGPVLVAHSGGPGCDWSYLRMPEVEKVATVVYIEPIGTGASARLANPAEYSRELDVSNVEGLRIHLGLDKIVLLGHSYGGFVAQTYALMYPQHLGGLLLYDTSPTNGPDFEKDVESNQPMPRRSMRVLGRCTTCANASARLRPPRSYARTVGEFVSQLIL